MPIPTKLFDVSNGNGVIDAGVPYPSATVIVYRDAAAKTKVLDAVARAGQYSATLPDGVTPNPQNKQAFFNKWLTNIIRDIVRNDVVSDAARAAATAAGATADADLPDK